MATLNENTEVSEKSYDKQEQQSWNDSERGRKEKKKVLEEEAESRGRGSEHMETKELLIFRSFLMKYKNTEKRKGVAIVRSWDYYKLVTKFPLRIQI